MTISRGSPRGHHGVDPLEQRIEELVLLAIHVRRSEVEDDRVRVQFMDGLQCLGRVPVRTDVGETFMRSSDDGCTAGIALQEPMS
ncbi:MAG: hypothetical protein ACOC8B_06140 [Gemmatimonadota bacterium]